MKGRSNGCESVTGTATDMQVDLICESKAGSTYLWAIDRISGYLWTNIKFNGGGRSVWEGVCRPVPGKLF